METAMLAERQRPKRMHHDTVHVSYAGSDWLVHYDYQPEEAMTLTYPGCEAEVDVCEIYLLDNPDESDWRDRLNDAFIAAIKEKVWETVSES